MADYYTTIVATETIKCSQEQFNLLDEALNDGDQESSHGFDTSFQAGEVFIFAEDCGDPDWLPELFIEEVGKLLREQEMPYLEFGMAYHCSKLRMDGFGGGYFRITDKGKLVVAEIVWPEEN